MAGPRRKDLTGQVFGELLVEGFSHIKDGNAYWYTSCSCGTRSVLKRGRIIQTQHCGPDHGKNLDLKKSIESIKSMKPGRNLTGKVFGTLTVIAESHIDEVGATYWHTVCTCGVKAVFRRDKIINYQCCGREHYKNLGIAEPTPMYGDDLTGLVIGELTVDKYSHGGVFWHTTCSCGVKSVLKRNKIINYKKCGRDHGRENTESYIYERYTGYMRDAQAREAKGQDCEFALSVKDFFKVAVGECYYCGNINPTRIINHRYEISKKGTPYFDFCGIDRINSNGGYTLDNIRTCCKSCNIMKSNLPEENFYNNIRQIYNYRNQSVPNKSNRQWSDNVINSKCKQIKKEAESRNKEFSLSDQEIKDIITDCCHYCGTDISYGRKGKKPQINGIDRIDSNIGYKKGNVVTCCTRCNIMKNNYKLGEFLNTVLQIYQRHCLDKKNQIGP